MCQTQPPTTFHLCKWNNCCMVAWEPIISQSETIWLLSISQQHIKITCIMTYERNKKHHISFLSLSTYYRSRHLAKKSSNIYPSIIWLLTFYSVGKTLAWLHLRGEFGFINKSNNKITGLRTIFQRESQNSWVYKQTKSVNNQKTVKTVMTLTWYRHFQRNGGLNQILRRQTSRFHYGSKVPAVTITVFLTILEQNR